MSVTANNSQNTEYRILVTAGGEELARQEAVKAAISAEAARLSAIDAEESEQVATEKAAQTVEDAASALASKLDAEISATDSGGFATNSGISASASNAAKLLSETAKVIAIEEAGKSSTSAGQSAASAAAAEAAKNQIIAINPLSVNSIGKINQVNLFPSYITLFNQINYPENPNLIFPNSIILHNNILIGVGFNGTTDTAISAFDLNGTNIWNRGRNPGPLPEYDFFTSSIIVLNNLIFTAGTLGRFLTKTSLDGVFNSSIDTGTARIKYHFVFGNNILTAINFLNTSNWVLRVYNEQLVQVGTDFSLPNIVTAISVLGDSIYIGSANLFRRYDFNFNLLNTYTHNNGDTTLCPIREEYLGPNLNRIVIGVGNRVMQFGKLTGALLSSYLINTLRDQIVSYIFDRNSLFLIFNDGSVVYLVAINGIIGFHEHNVIMKLIRTPTGVNIGNIVVDSQFTYIPTLSGIVKINNLL